jgi:hypothetical protein
MGFGHGTTSTDANDRARIGVNILGGGQGRLFFTTGASGSQVSAMFIDESQRVGIGTTAPGSILDIASTTGSITNTRYTASNTLGANLILQKSFNNTNLTNTAVPSGDIIGRIVWKSNTGSGFNSASSAEMRAEQVGIASATNNGSKIVFATTAQNATNFSDRMTITDAGNVGIGTTAPTSKLEVNGAATNNTSINTSNTTIDYSLSNLAATTNTATSITLSNIKNGGAYTLAFTSTAASGVVTFTASGFTFVYIGTVARTAGKKHIYNFVVIGTEVFVTMGTEN